MVNIIVSVGYEVTQFQFIFGQLPSDKFSVNCSVNHGFSYHKVLIICSVKGLITFDLFSFYNEADMRVISRHYKLFGLDGETSDFVFDHLSYEVPYMVQRAVFLSGNLPDISSVSSDTPFVFERTS